jgi:peroxiredoxin
LRQINRYHLTLSILILGLGLVWIGISAKGRLSDNHDIPAPRPNFPAPGFSLVNLDGQKIQLSDFLGRPVIVNFWASWCPPCRAEMPAFQDIFTEYEDQGIVFLAVNSQESRANALDFARSNALTFTILLDEDGEVSNLYRVLALPATFFINRNGQISEVVYGGPISEAYLRIQVEKLLKEDR